MNNLSPLCSVFDESQETISRHPNPLHKVITPMHLRSSSSSIRPGVVDLPCIIAFFIQLPSFFKTLSINYSANLHKVLWKGGTGAR